MQRAVPQAACAYPLGSSVHSPHGVKGLSTLVEVKGQVESGSKKTLLWFCDERKLGSFFLIHHRFVFREQFDF